MRAHACAVALAALAALALAFAGVHSAYAAGVDCEIADCAKSAFTWDSSTNTLTMKEASIDCPSVGYYYDLVHFSPDGTSDANPTATVVLAGTVQVSANGVVESVIGTDDVDLVITGPQSLVVTGRCTGHAIRAFRGGITVRGGHLSLEGDGNSIEAYNDFVIDSADADVSVRNVGDECGITVGGNFTMNNGTLYVDGSSSGVYCTGRESALTIAGGAATLGTSFIGLQSAGDVNLTGGQVIISAMEQSGIELNKDVTLDGAEVVIDGPATQYGIYSDKGGLAAKSGTLIISNCDMGIRLADGTLFNQANTATINGASVNLNKMQWTAIEVTNLNLKSGTLKIDGCNMGLEAYDSFVMTGGNLNVKATAMGLYANKKFHIVGGSATIECRNARNFAFSTGSNSDVKVDPSCLTVKTGCLEAGVTFKAGGSTYVVNDSSGAVTLKSYGGTSKTPTVNVVKYGGFTYKVEAIGASAFATAKGKAIKKLMLGKNVEIVGAKAFAGTTNLVTLDATNFRYSGAELAKTAFKNCGKSKGAKLTVLCKSRDKDPMQKLLVSKGLSKKATFKAK